MTMTTSLTMKQMMEMPSEQRGKLSQQQMRAAILDGQRHKRRELAKRRRAARVATGDAKVAAVGYYMSLLDSQDRIAELVPLIMQETPEIFWPIFIDNWSSCDAAWEWQRVLIPIFQRVGPYPLGNVDAFWWDDLPDQLTLYRGADRSRIEGAVSWTTDKEIARRFACGHRGIRNPDPVIAVATIAKADIFAATNDRNESEVLCLPSVTAIYNNQSEMK
jgi:hypothetical protein